MLAANKLGEEQGGPVSVVAGKVEEIKELPLQQVGVGLPVPALCSAATACPCSWLVLGCLCAPAVPGHVLLRRLPALGRAGGRQGRASDMGLSLCRTASLSGLA